MLRLKEKPREWQKFVAVMCLVVNLPLWMMWWKHRLSLAIPVSTASVGGLVLLAALIRPVWFRGFYRGGMTICFHIGQVIGKVLLTAFFFVVVTPLGLLLRLLGKDLLQIKSPEQESTWWKPAKNTREFDRMF